MPALGGGYKRTGRATIETALPRGEHMTIAAVVGAGFAGLIIARELARSGVSVDIYEEHRKVGYPKHCTGLVSERTVRLIGRPALESLEAWIGSLEMRAGQEAIQVPVRVARLDRVKLEELLLEEASSLGARSFLGARIERVILEGNSVTLSLGHSKKKYDYVVIAEGLHGHLRKHLGIRHEPVTSIGLNLDVPCTQGSLLTVIAGQGRGVWFSWLAPAGTNRTVVGALGPLPGAVKREAQALARRCGGPLEIYGGRVIHGPPLEPSKAAGKNYLIAGDAAALNKPLTGGGLYPGSLLASLTREAISRGLDLARAASAAYKMVYRELKRQHALAMPLLRGGLYIVVREAARAGLNLGGEPIDYDRHASLPWVALRRSPGRALLLALHLLLASPRTALQLVLGALLG